MRQLAKLLLRGALVNVTMKNLNETQSQSVNELLEAAWNDPIIQNPKHEFAITLSRRIGNEYRKIDVGLQDAYVTFWRCAAEALYHQVHRCEKCAQTKKPKLYCTSLGMMHFYDKSYKDPKTGDRGRWVKIECDNNTICPDCGAQMVLHKGPKWEIATTRTYCCKKHELPEGSHGDYWVTKNGHVMWDGFTPESCCPLCDKKAKGKFIKRKKYFQSFMFNYLRQIFKENRPRNVKREVMITSPADSLFMSMFRSILEEEKIDYDVYQRNDYYEVQTNLGSIPYMVFLRINQLADEFNQYGVELEYDEQNSLMLVRADYPLNDPHQGVIIDHAVSKEVFINFVSLDSPTNDEEENSMQDYVDFKQHNVDMTQKSNIDDMDSIGLLRSRVNDAAQKIVDLIIDTPTEYINKFGTEKIFKSHLAKWLDKKPKEINDLYGQIQVQALALGMSL